MLQFTGFCYLLLICSWYQVCMANPFLVAKAVYENAMLLYNGAQTARSVFGIQKEQRSQNEIYDQLKELRNDFLDFKHEMMSKISSDLKDKLEDKSTKFFGYTLDIESKYNRFVKFVQYPAEYENTALINFANECTISNLPRTIERMYESVIHPDIKGDNLISIIARDSTAQDLMCIKQESKQQLINDLHQAFVNSSTKALMVTLYSYDLKAKFENIKYRKERQDAKHEFRSRVRETFEAVQKALKMSSREMWRCDPAEHQKGVTYDKLQEIFQAYFVNEFDTIRTGGEVNDIWDFVWSLGKGVSNNCGEMGDERLRCDSAICKAQPEWRRCTGHMRDCESMPSWSQVCHAPPHSERRYDWLRLSMKSDVPKYGRFYEDCHDRTQGVENGPAQPDVCICNCESEGRDKDRYFSLQDVVSDVDDNKVVTGVKLAKDNHVFHIQIQQGRLGPNGTIIGEPKWKNISSISKTQLLNTTISTSHDGEVKFHKNDLVYAVSYSQKYVLLDNLSADPNGLVTGLRFQQVGDSLRFEIRTTPFDYTSGELNVEESSWRSNLNYRRWRDELSLGKPDDPVQHYNSKDIPTDNQYIQFRMTDLDRDFGQFTVPFIDIQNVTTNPPMPLSGAGLFLRGQRGSGGFLALKVVHYDYTDHL